MLNEQTVSDLNNPEIVADLFFPLWADHADTLAAVLQKNVPARVMGLKSTAPYGLMFASFCVGVEAALSMTGDGK